MKETETNEGEAFILNIHQCILTTIHKMWLVCFPLICDTLTRSDFKACQLKEDSLNTYVCVIYYI